jgi:hypothetical protein
MTEQEQKERDNYPNYFIQKKLGKHEIISIQRKCELLLSHPYNQREQENNWTPEQSRVFELEYVRLLTELQSELTPDRILSILQTLQGYKQI